MTSLRSGMLVLALICCLAVLSCSATVTLGSRDGWYDQSDNYYRSRHDPWWYYEDYDRDGVINGRDAYPYDSWWW